MMGDRWSRLLVWAVNDGDWWSRLLVLTVNDGGLVVNTISMDSE